MQSPASIAIVAYSGVQMSAVLGLQDLLEIANRKSRAVGGPVNDVHIVEATAGAELPQEILDALILPPNLCGARGDDDRKLWHWLARQHASGALLCSACAGAFWLGHAGVLDRRPATTHWALEEEFRHAFPSVELYPERILVDDGDIVTAGGVMAWLDLGLLLVERWQGVEIVTQTARHLLIDPSGREQKNYRSFRPRLSHGDRPILKVQHMLAADPQSDHRIARLADMAGLSPRTFQRRFRSATGLTARAYIQNLRIEKARGLLERTRLSANEISWRVGYNDVTAFSRVFHAVTGLTISEYRTRFHVSRAVTPSRPDRD